MIAFRLPAWLRALAAALLLVACGGGVETGGTGATGSYVEGPITGFGSLIAGRIRFDDRSALVTDADDQPIDRSRLRLGMLVEVQGDRPVDDGSGDRRATASRVRLGASLLGPLESIGPTAMRIVVLGQVVHLTGATAFDGVSGGVSGLSIGDVLEVHGFPGPGAAPWDLMATRIERHAVAPASYRVRGVAREVNAAAVPPTLRVGSQAFDLSPSGVPAGLSNGVMVRLTLGAAPVNGRWPVERAVVEARQLGDHAEARVEGLITSFGSATSFAVNGITVDASGASFPDGSAGLGLGVRVEVEGRSAGGTLVASRVEPRSDDETVDEGIDLRGPLSGLDAAARSFVLRGTTVWYGSTPPPQFVQGSEADLANGRCVRVRARLDSDGVRAVATRIEFRNNCEP